MVDEPVADLCHADARSLPDMSTHSPVDDGLKVLTLAKTAFCSSLGYGFAMFCRTC